METDDIFAFVIVSALLIAAAIPLDGIVFTRKKKSAKEANTAKKPEIPQAARAVYR